MKVKAIVYGKKGCSLCDNRKSVIEKFPAVFKKETGKDISFDLESHDISTVEGLVSFCSEERSNSDIPVVVLEDEKGATLKVYHGPTSLVSSKGLLEVFNTTATS